MQKRTQSNPILSRAKPRDLIPRPAYAECKIALSELWGATSNQVEGSVKIVPPVPSAAEGSAIEGVNPFIVNSHQWNGHEICIVHSTINAIVTGLVTAAARRVFYVDIFGKLL
jgi:hypothetical protein